MTHAAARLFTAASVALGAFALAGCQDDNAARDTRTERPGLDTYDTGSATAADRMGRYPSDSPSISGGAVSPGASEGVRIRSGTQRIGSGADVNNGDLRSTTGVDAVDRIDSEIQRSRIEAGNAGAEAATGNDADIRDRATGAGAGTGAATGTDAGTGAGAGTDAGTDTAPRATDADRDARDDTGTGTSAGSADRTDGTPDDSTVGTGEGGGNGPRDGSLRRVPEIQPGRRGGPPPGEGSRGDAPRGIDADNTDSSAGSSTDPR